MMMWYQLSVVVLLVCAVKCLAISYIELQDFADYLKKSSQLSPSLKHGTGDFDFDEEEDNSISEHAWEESGKFEGDLILNQRQQKLIVNNVAEGLARNGIIDGAKRWPDNEVIFAIQVEHFSNDQVQAILQGIDDLARASCVKFRRYRKGDRDAVVIQGNRRGCFSQVGYQGGFQVLNLNSRHPVGRGCFRHGTIVHEMLHTLGFFHMQSSPDRDDYVKIVWENILKTSRHNFQKYSTFSVSDFGVGYDYDSVLHYSGKAFSINGRPTIIPKQAGAQIGQRLRISDKDAEKLNKMYCDTDSDGLQTVEDATEKPKKKTKNKPFDGEGIGYHKGIAVVIKLLPGAESYKLAEVPKSYTFDYFSKTPQVLPTAEKEDFQVGKKIEFPFNPVTPMGIKEFKVPLEYNTQVEIPITINKNKQEKELHKEDDSLLDMGALKYMNHNDENANSMKKHGDSSIEPPHRALDEAFDRLSKILKSHVYPSQTPDLSIYKMFDKFTKGQSQTNQGVKMENKENVEEPLYPIRDMLSKGEEMTSEIHIYDGLSPIVAANGYYDKSDRESDKKEKPIEASPEYKDIFSKYEEPSYLGRKGDDDYERYSNYSSRLLDGEKSQRSHDEWDTPYRYNPSKYDSESFRDYSRRYLGDDYGDSSNPYSKPLHSDKYR